MKKIPTESWGLHKSLYKYDGTTDETKEYREKQHIMSRKHGICSVQSCLKFESEMKKYLTTELWHILSFYEEFLEECF